MKKCQSIVEYTVLAGIVALALAGMHTYAKRGIQAITKVSADKLTQGFGGQEANTAIDSDWLDAWQPQEPLAISELSSENVTAQTVDSLTGKVKKVKGGFWSNETKYFSIGGEKIDKKLE